MKSLSRVVWSEGMHLAQHHFQLQNRYFEDLTGFALSSLFFEPYGLAGCELDAEALLNGTVAVTYARGIMPDGLPFHFPVDSPPEPLEIRELFSPTHDSHLVLLTIQPERVGRPNCALEPGANGDLRFTASPESVLDETTGQDERAVSVARKNFQLALDTGERGDLVWLPIARVRRDGAGHFVYDRDYIPPCIRVEASQRLVELLARLVEVLDAKADAMAAERSGQGSVADYASKEVASFWLSHAIHSAVAPLRHELRTRTSHPEKIFVELSRLAGALCTFSMTAHPRDLPLYDHQNLDRCFGALEQHIQAHLEVVLPTNAMTVTLKPVDQYLYAGSIKDRRCFGKSHWFLGVRSSASAAEVTSRVPKLVKICSAKHIVRLVKEAYPGLTLEYVPAPPPDLSPRIGTHYFSMQKIDPCWQSIVETGQIGVYVPAAIRDVELDLAVVVES